MDLEKQNAGTLTSTSNGFSLIELMIVVAIVGILATIAYPSYTQYVARGKITEAHSLLADYRVRIEQYYQDHRNYAPANGSCGAAASSSQYFTLSCNATSDNEGNVAQTYIATATSNAGQGLGAAGDYTFTINESNAKATEKFQGNSFAPAKPCWLVKGDEC